MKKFFSSPMRIAMTIIFGLLGFHALLFLGRLYLTGFPAEWCGKIQGFAFTPFFMEFLLIAFGLFSVMVINHFRQKWEGDELVYLEVVDDPNAQLPDGSKSVIFKERAEQQNSLELSIAAIEGAIEMNDHKEAKELFSKISPKDHPHPSVQAISNKLNL